MLQRMSATMGNKYSTMKQYIDKENWSQEVSVQQQPTWCSYIVTHVPHVRIPDLSTNCGKICSAI